MLQAGLAMAQQQAQGTLARYLPGLSLLHHELQRYFDVSNSYVLFKLGLVLFPFAFVTKNWSRTRKSQTEFAPASVDNYAFDLYIPSMAITSYVVAVGLVVGSTGTFSPEVLVETFFSMIGVQLFQVLLLKVGVSMAGAVVPPAPSPL